MRLKRKGQFRDSDAKAAVMSRYANGWGLLKVIANPERFHIELDTQARRQAFAQLFPSHFVNLFGFERSSYSSLRPFFQRHRVTDYLTEHSVDLASFDPPDLRDVPPKDQTAIMTMARGRWWTQQRLPITEAERMWLAEHLPDIRLSAAYRACDWDTTVRAVSDGIATHAMWSGRFQ